MEMKGVILHFVSVCGAICGGSGFLLFLFVMEPCEPATRLRRFESVKESFPFQLDGEALMTAGPRRRQSGGKRASN